MSSAMPVALSKRSWEDHVTSRWRTQYSYDDLDLVCWHGILGNHGSPVGRAQRERCASMPECQMPGVSEGEEDEDLPTKISKLFPKGFKVVALSVFEREDTQSDSSLGQDLDVVKRAMSEQDIDQFSESSAGQSCDFSQSAPVSSPVHTEANLNSDQACKVCEETIVSDLSTKVLQEDPKKYPSQGDCSEITLKALELTHNLNIEVTKLEDPKVTDGDSLPEACAIMMEPEEEMTLPNKTSEKFSPVPLSPRETFDHCDGEKVSGAISVLDINKVVSIQVLKDPAVPDIEFEADFTDPHTVSDTQNTCKLDLNPSSDLMSSQSLPGVDKRASKLDTILEVSFTESGEETIGQIMAEIPELSISAALMNSKDVEKGPVLQECTSKGLTEKDTLENSKVTKLPISESSMETNTGIPRYEGHNIGHEGSPSVDVSDGLERPQEPPVRLRTWKSPRDRERERSRLDSMVLLIMKLDQLDQEIESALSSTPSYNDMPTLKRRIISETAAVSMDGDKSLSGSLQSLDAPYHYSSSSLSSTGRSRTPKALEAPGAKPKNRGCAPSSEKNRAEIEAKEACTWLRAAGFPQYAQLYEDGQFPIEILSVTRDHDFLDRDAIEALCRRLNTLNKCARMRLEITPQRKRSEDSDDDEPCAISGRWTFQRDSKRWSRLDQLDLDVFLPPAGDGVSAPPLLSSQDKRLPGGPLLREGVNASSESVLSDLSEQPEVGSLHSAGSGGHSTTVPSSPVTTISNVATAPTTRASSVVSICSSGTSGANEDSLSEGLPSPLEHGSFPFEAKSHSGSSAGSKSTRSRAKSFLKRMESLRLRSSSTASKRKKKGAASQGRLEISGPVLKEGFDEDKLRRFNCVDITSLDCNGNRNRSTSYSTQTSSGSTGSSQSETSSGSAVSTPSPVTRTRSHSTAAGSTKRAGMYLEGFDPFSLVLMQENENLENCNRGRRTEPNTTVQNNQRNFKRSEKRQAEDKRTDDEGGVIYFYLPEGHKPGTFPKALADGEPCLNVDRKNHRVHCGVSSTFLDSRLSFYDNVPFPEMQDEEEEDEDPDGEEEPKMEAVLEQVSDLQRLVNAWSESGPGDEEEEEEEEGDSDSALDSASPCPSSPLQNHLEEAENGSDQESRLGEQDNSLCASERRDSGVGPSLTRTNRPQKLRWPSFQNSHRPNGRMSLLQVGCQSVLQMNLLQKYSLLKLTALLEKHTPTNKHGFSWAVPKFMKKMKVRDFKDRSVFGVPLQVNVQRSGQPLPQGIQQAMRYLRDHCLDQVGLFRKSGVKSRIQALRQMNESCGTDGFGVSYDGQSAYDVADMLKQYFRDLPEPLFTSKLADTFLQIYQYMPVDQQLQAVRAAVLLLPDESREALQTLLCFLSDVTANVVENQMTCMNLAVCLAPSLFHLNSVKRDASSPRVISRKNALGKPDQRDLNENLAATHGLTHMIQECRKLFQVPEELSHCRNSYVDQALSPMRMDELRDSYRSVVKETMDMLLKEAKDRFRGYESCGTLENMELAYRKVNDGRTLRQWKVCVEVAAAPDEVLQRIIREQSRWDEDLIETRVLETLDSSTEVYQFVRNNMAPHPPTEYVVLRSWVTDLPKGVCALVCVSVDHEAAPVLGVRANMLTSRYFIEPCGNNKSRLTYISRTDCRGRCPEWYVKLYGHLCVSELVGIRDTFSCPLDK
ncbi:rho GTPase-activating protein 7 [Hoplias malabaricus]|uniref:rho GTPase-activating protein 7 n=1 Tax=Hoplias malabaricus TaxID=27720 RepID=UPI003462ED6B